MKFQYYLLILLTSITKLLSQDCITTEVKDVTILIIEEAPGVNEGRGMLIAYSNKTLSVVNHEFIWMNEKIMSNDIVGMKSMLVEESIGPNQVAIIESDGLMSLFQLLNQGYIKFFHSYNFTTFTAFDNINGTTYIILCNGDSNIIVWHGETGAVQTLVGHAPNNCKDISSIIGTDYFVSVGDHNEIKIWNSSPLKLIGTINDAAENYLVKDIQGTNYIAVYCQEEPNVPIVRIYNYRQGTRIAQFHVDTPEQFFTLPDKNLLAVRTNKDITFYDYTTFKLKHTFVRGANKLNTAVYFTLRTDQYQYYVLTAGSEALIIYFNSINIGCATCDATSKMCLTCNANHYFYSPDSACLLIDSCPSGFWGNANICEACGGSCATCQPTVGTNCLTCKAGYYAENYACISDVACTTASNYYYYNIQDYDTDKRCKL